MKKGRYVLSTAKAPNFSQKDAAIEQEKQVYIRNKQRPEIKYCGS